MEIMFDLIVFDKKIVKFRRVMNGSQCRTNQVLKVSREYIFGNMVVEEREKSERYKNEKTRTARKKV